MRRWLAGVLLVVGCKAVPTPVVPVGDVECPPGSVHEGLRCVWAEVTCPERTAWDGQHCVYDAAAVCPEGTELRQGACFAEVIDSCPPGTEFEPGRGCLAVVVEAPPPRPTRPTRSVRVSNEQVDCILDPSRCPKAKPSGVKTKLTTTDIKQGITQVKADAKACGARHGAAPGTKVTVKIVVKGATGRVSTVKAGHDHAGTPLGTCVEDAIRAARFPTFANTQMGFQYKVRM